MTRTLRVVIADDEPLARQRIRRLLRAESDFRIAAECADGVQTTDAVLRESPDLLFLDVQMPALDGFAVLRGVPAERMPVTVFVTAYDRYALRAFEARALDYLLKPYSEARFRQALERAREQITLLRDAAEPPDGAAAGVGVARLLVREDGRVRVVAVEDVDYLEAARNYVRIHAGPATHLLREPLASLEARLDPARFARIHRSIVVNVDRVTEIEPWFSGDCHVLLRGGVRLRLSRGHREALERRLR